MLALSLRWVAPIHFVAPAFGFQKNIPYPDNDKLRKMITQFGIFVKSLEFQLVFIPAQESLLKIIRLLEMYPK